MGFGENLGKNSKHSSEYFRFLPMSRGSYCGAHVLRRLSLFVHFVTMGFTSIAMVFPSPLK